MPNNPKSHCKRGHPLVEENLYRGSNGRQCKTCVLENVKKRYHGDVQVRQDHKQDADRWRENNQDKDAQCRLRERLKKYKITVEQYYELLELANYKCQICGNTSKLDIDHNHKTGKIRGMLCHNHNAGIGLLDDDPNLIRKAAEYLERHNVSSSN